MSGSDEKSPELPLQDAADVAADAGASQASGADTAAGASQVSETSTDSSLSQPPDSESRLDVARRFLEDESVRDSPREKKVEFLRSKDLTDEEIEQLLGQEPQPSPEVRLVQSPAARPFPADNASSLPKNHKTSPSIRNDKPNPSTKNPLTAPR